MNALDIIPFTLPILIVVIVMFVKMRRLNKQSKNLFRTGGAVPLPQPIQVSTFMQREQFIKANQQLTNKLIFGKTGKIVVTFIFFFIGISVFSKTFFSINHQSLQLEDFTPLIVMAGAVLVYGFLMRSTSGSVYDKTEFAKEAVKYSFDANGYQSVGANNSITGSWQNVQGFSETDEYLLVFTGPTQAFFLDKQAFADNDLETFRAFLLANFEVKKQLI